MIRSEHDLRAAYREPLDPAALDRLRTTIDELGIPPAQSPRHRSRWLLPVSAAVVLIAVFAAIVVHDRSVDRAGSALALWADFPVNATPRPLVLTGPAILDPPEGFPNGDDKAAYVDGQFALGTTLPTGPSTVDGQPVTTAAQALAELRSKGDSKHPQRKPLLITEVALGRGMFATDRGTRSLPAWVFHFAGTVNPAVVLAIPPTDRWPRPGMPMGAGDEGGMTISASGDQVTVSFVGLQAGDGPCEAEYAGDVKQSATAVAIAVRELPNPNQDPGQCGLVGYFRTVTVTLHSPLGNRVVLDSHGVPLPTG